MELLLAAIASFLLPVIAGCCLVSALWPECPRILKGVWGTGLGLGLAGVTWMLGLLITGSTAMSFVASESLLLTLTVVLRFRKTSFRARPADPPQPPLAKSPMGLATALIVTAVLAASSVAFMVNLNHHGEFDALAIWNSRARFLYLSDKPREILPDLTAPDYPLLLPGLIVRGWQYSRRHTVVIPMTLGVLATAGSFAVLVSGLRLIGSGIAPLLAGCMLLGTPFFLRNGLAQFADMTMCFFMTSTVLLFLIADSGRSGSSRLPLLSGLFAGFALATKNEGTLFFLVVVAARLCVMLWDRRWRSGIVQLGLFFAGSAWGMLALVVFKTRMAVPNPIADNLTGATLLNRIVDTSRHLLILDGFKRDLLHWGSWWLNPLALMIVYVVLHRRVHGAAVVVKQWRFPALVVAFMLCGYYQVYLFSPYSAEWHVVTSLPRLIVQLWPTALTLWASLMMQPPSLQTNL